MCWVLGNVLPFFYGVRGAWERPNLICLRRLQAPSELPDNKSMFQRAPGDSQLEKHSGLLSFTCFRRGQGFTPRMFTCFRRGQGSIPGVFTCFGARAGLTPTSFYVFWTRAGLNPRVFTCFWPWQGLKPRIFTCLRRRRLSAEKTRGILETSQETPLAVRGFLPFLHFARVFTWFWPIGGLRGLQGGGRGRVNPPPLTGSNTPDPEGRRIYIVSYRSGPQILYIFT